MLQGRQEVVLPYEITGSRRRLLVWRCPGEGCDRPVTVLHRPETGPAFLCRQCLGLVYCSQYQSKGVRFLLRYLELSDEVEDPDTAPERRERLQQLLDEKLRPVVDTYVGRVRKQADRLERQVPLVSCRARLAIEDGHQICASSPSTETTEGQAEDQTNLCPVHATGAG